MGSESTGRKAQTKRQHYVPRFVLRNFSRNGTQIPLLHLATGKRVPDASIARQCYGDYFYGDDDVLEQSFSNEEAKWSQFFGDLDPARFERLDGNQLALLRLFAMYQHARTLGAAEHVNEMHSSLARMALKDKLARDQRPTFTAADIEGLSIRLTNAPYQSIWQAVQSMPCFIDLSAKFIYTERTPGFVISDNPAVVYNQFVEKHEHLRHFPTSHGLLVKGLQMFVPLSPNMTLALFDPAVYEYGGKKTVCRAGPGDVAFLNRMQAVSASSCVYFREDRITDEVLVDLAATRKRHPSIYEQKAAFIEREDGGSNRVFFTYRPDIRLGASLSFIRQTDGHSYADHVGAVPPVRSREQEQLSHDFSEALERHVEQKQAEMAAAPEGVTAGA
jgi:Protein of unknown function (DUF4238)